MKRAARLWFRMTLAGMVAVALAWVLFPFPVDKLARYPASTRILDRDGQPLRVVLNENDALCLPVRLGETGPWLAKAFIAAEDKRFYQHCGVDLLAVARATAQNVRARHVRSGASTIPLQLVRLVEPRRRNLLAKLVESFRVLQLEQHLSKRQILEQYLNRAPLGSNLNGVEAASWRYFAKSAGDLSLPEAALLAGLPQSPSRLRPDRYPQRAATRRDYVLQRMFECGFISRDQWQSARLEAVNCGAAAVVFRAPHFCDLVMRRLPLLPVLHTTLDGRIQAVAEAALGQRAAGLSRQDIHGGAAVVIEVRTGAVRALVGSPDFWKARWQGQVNGAVAPRSPGSALKPFVFALALDDGWCTPATMIGDVPMVLPGYHPENFDRQFRGPVSAREALVKSLNIPALRLTQQLGPENVVRLLRRAGLRTLTKPAQQYGLGIALGDGEVTLLEVANAYAALARLGEYRELRLLEDHAAGTPARLLSAPAAWLVTEMLSGDERAADVCGHAADVRRPRIAWKTGTSAGFRDAWAIGYNPEYVVAVWLGNPDGAPSRALVAREVTSPLVYDIFRRLYPEGNAPWFQRPDGLQMRMVCARSGLVPTDRCESTVVDWSLDGVSATAECGVHQRLADGRVVEVWPPEIEAFLRQRGMLAEPGRTVRAGETLHITSPRTGAQFCRLPDERLPRQAVPLTAGTDAASRRLYWFVDGELFGTCAAGETIFWPLRGGDQVIACTDDLGRHDSVRVTVE